MSAWGKRAKAGDGKGRGAPEEGPVTVLFGREGGLSAAERSAGLAAVRIG